jgi:hypothetical protein
MLHALILLLLATVGGKASKPSEAQVRAYLARQGVPVHLQDQAIETIRRQDPHYFAGGKETPTARITANTNAADFEEPKPVAGEFIQLGETYKLAFVNGTASAPLAITKDHKITRHAKFYDVVVVCADGSVARGYLPQQGRNKLSIGFDEKHLPANVFFFSESLLIDGTYLEMLNRQADIIYTAEKRNELVAIVMRYGTGKPFFIDARTRQEVNRHTPVTPRE